MLNRKIWQALLSCLLLIGQPVNANEENRIMFKTGQDLIDLCTADDALMIGQCIGYVMAIVDYDSVLEARNLKPQEFCLSKEAVLETALIPVIGFLSEQKRSDLAGLSASGFVNIALRKKFPCGLR